MIAVKIVGGLGNQMFQYAYAKALEQKGFEVKIDISAYDSYYLHGGYQLDKYNIDLIESTPKENNKYYSNSIFSKILRKLGIETSKVIREKSLLYDETFLDLKDDNYIEGYFQSEKYFKNLREILSEQFTIKQELSIYSKKIESKILENKNNCSLHIRRGDFVNASNISIHGSCDLEYYNKAIKYLEEKIDNISYFIFSDDIDWCTNNLKIENAIFINNKKRRIPHEDIYLMSLCNYNIIANSSFSWWAAWLNSDENKIVVAPKKWFEDYELECQSKDIVCKSWVKI